MLLSSVLKLQVTPSLASSLRERLSSREVDYTNFYSELLPLCCSQIKPVKHVNSHVFESMLPESLPLDEIRAATHDYFPYTLPILTYRYRIHQGGMERSLPALAIIHNRY